MNMSIIPADRQLSTENRDQWIDRQSRRQVLKKLSAITRGKLVIRENEQTWEFGKADQSQGDLLVFIEIHHSGFWPEIALGGTNGAGESYINGLWSCSDLVSLTRLMLQNRDVLDGMDTKFTRLKQPLQRFLHVFRRNTKAGSRRNISAHYDVGNRFFSLFLDRTMMYSSAIFAHDGQGLYEASVNKLDHVCKQLELSPQDHLLEIGTGWGGLAIHAAKNYGCRVTTTTLSKEQYEWACQAVEKAGVQDKVTLLMKDYRELEGSFDKLVSIEMIEAIGHQYMDTYFRQCRQLLRPGGKMLIQAITIKDQYYHQAIKEAGFYQNLYISRRFSTINHRPQCFHDARQ